MQKPKFYVDIIAHNNKNRAKLEYNMKKFSHSLVDGDYEIIHPYQGFRSVFTITGNHCVCDYYDQEGVLISHSEYTDLTPDEWPKPDFDEETYDIVHVPGLIDDISEI